MKNDNEKNKKEGNKKMAPVEYEEYYTSGFPKDMKRNKYNLILNDRLKEARKVRGFSLAQVVNMLNARGVKTGRSTVQGYEAPEQNMNHRYPSLNMLDHICSLYNVDMNYIFGYSDEMERHSQDLLQQIEQSKKVLWNGKEMTQGQKQLLIEKANDIMNV